MDFAAWLYYPMFVGYSIARPQSANIVPEHLEIIMPRAYSARLVALALGVQPKWLDNLLSHFHVPGVAHGRQGVERQISDTGLLAIELVRIGTSELGMSVARAAHVASQVVTSPSRERHFVTPSGAAVHFPLAQIEQRLREKMVAAIESVPRVPRGRPPLS